MKIYLLQFLLASIIRIVFYYSWFTIDLIEQMKVYLTLIIIVNCAITITEITNYSFYI